MHGPISTAGKIDQFESRFTLVGGAHFLIAPNGEEAWPVSAAEAAEFKGLYRRRMERARWIRRAVFIVPFGLLLLSMAGAAVPDWLAAWVLMLYLVAVPPAFLQHKLTSDLTRRGIERQLQRRITTRLQAAITPERTMAGVFGKRLLMTCVAVEIGVIALHLAMDRAAFAAHMRVLYGRTAGNESVLAQLTGHLAWLAQYGLVLAVLLMIADRLIRRRRASSADARAPSARHR